MLLILLSLAGAVAQPLPLQPFSAADLQGCYTTLYAQTPSTEPCETLAQSSDPQTAAHALSVLAMIYANRGDLMLARRYIDDAVAKWPDDSIVQGNHGNLLLLEQRFEDAVRVYDRALTLPGAYPAFLLLNRSLALRALGDYAGSQADYQQYLALLAQQRQSR